jgi:ABC-type multidrug transport system ATPase subunit
MYCLTTDDLSHHFGPDPVLKSLNLRVPTGAIYGFLGPNGAGKTTTLRLLLGLLIRQRGTISIFGQPIGDHNGRERLAILRRVGSLIESPSLYDHLTARENLAVWQHVFLAPVARITEVLELVGLGHTGHKRVSQFSLGMKQRLSLAVALLHSPDLLILDEPTNGLDPAGIVDMRALLQTLNQERGTTILISSHLLAEIDKLVTHAGIINRGEMIFEGPMAELKSKQDQVASVTVRTSANDRAASIAATLGLTTTLEPDALHLPPMSRDQVARLTRLLVESDLDVYEVGVARHDLEAIFMGLTGDRS